MTNQSLKGETIVFTGMNRSQIDVDWYIKEITKRGGLVRQKVSSVTTILLIRDSHTNNSVVKNVKNNFKKVKIMPLSVFCKKHKIHGNVKGSKSEYDSEDSGGSSDDDDESYASSSDDSEYEKERQVKRRSNKKDKYYLQFLVKVDDDDEESYVIKKSKAPPASATTKPIVKKRHRHQKKRHRRRVFDNESDSDDSDDFVRKVMDDSDGSAIKIIDENSMKQRLNNQNSYFSGFNIESESIDVNKFLSGDFSELQYRNIPIQNIMFQIPVVIKKVLENPLNGYEIVKTEYKYLGYRASIDALVMCFTVKKKDSLSYNVAVNIKVTWKSTHRTDYQIMSLDVLPKTSRKVMNALDSIYKDDIIHVAVRS